MSKLRFLPRSLFSQRAEWVTDDVKTREELRTCSKAAKAGVVALTSAVGVVGTDIVFRMVFNKEMNMPMKTAKDLAQVFMAGNPQSLDWGILFGFILGHLVPATTFHSEWLHSTSEMGKRKASRRAWGGFRFIDRSGKDWRLATKKGIWTLTKISDERKEDDQSWDFTSPSTWNPGDLHQIAGTKVTVEVSQGQEEITVKKGNLIQTGNSNAQDVYSLVGGASQDAVAMAIYITRAEHTLPWGYLMIIAIVVGGASALTYLMRKDHRIKQKPRYADYGNL